jgi:hypothetical protein
VVLVGGRLGRRRDLSAAGVRIRVTGEASLDSAVPLGFSPGIAPGTPLLVTGDAQGLGAVSGLQGVYQTSSWLATPALAHLDSWDLAGTEQRLERAQARLLGEGAQFSLSAPFDGLGSAIARADAAPERLLGVGGGALAALAVFVILAAHGLRRDEELELRRLRDAGAGTSQIVTFACAEAAWLSFGGVLGGAALGVALGAGLAGDAGLAAGAVLAHSLLSSAAPAVALGGWLAATVVIAAVLLLPGGAIADLLALAAAAALALALSEGGGLMGPPALLLAPLACVAAGVLVYRLGAVTMRAAERLSRRGPPTIRLALISLARRPGAPALATAFVAVSVGLAGFALAYRATLERGTADEAAGVVPLDALVGSSPTFATPLMFAGLRRWRQIAGGTVLQVRRTYGSVPGAGADSPVVALGVPASGLALIRGWRSSDGSAPLGVLARRLAPTGPVRTPGPVLPLDARALSLTMAAPDGGVQVTADLRTAAGTIDQLDMGVAAAHARTVRVTLPAGRLELEALELDAPTGLAITSGHQNGENSGAATQATTVLMLGSARVLTADGVWQPVGGRRGWRGWRAVGAAAVQRGGAGSLRIAFEESGAPGIVRPVQPSDRDALPVIVDPATAAAAARGGRLPLSVDGLPVSARIVGVVRRFPTVAPGTGFVIADQSALGGALDASAPGQGRPDELWIDTSSTTRLRTALRRGRLSSLSARYRAVVLSTLRSDPVTRAVLGTLVAAAAVATVLAVVGLLVALLGAMRDPAAEREFEVQGLDPRRLRDELGLRVALAGLGGTLAGLIVAVLLAPLAVVTLRAAGAVAVPEPPPVTVVPVGDLARLALAVTLAVLVAAWLGAAAATRRRDARQASEPRVRTGAIVGRPG